ncbi:hypothetical protein [Photorhabdus asymbiotica]|uniref:hypothetical protein n=1 Tax=Photorhabdus asymbiotica TaxID=291112 RepID=UPI003DA761CB
MPIIGHKEDLIRTERNSVDLTRSSNNRQTENLELNMPQHKRDSKDIEHAVIYGFSQHRGPEMQKAFADNKNPVTIDEYNAGLGIMGELSLSDYFRISQDLKENRLPELNEKNIQNHSLKYFDAMGVNMKSADPNVKEEAKEQQRAYTRSWGFYMMENKEKLDIQSKINNLIPKKKSFFSKSPGEDEYEKLDEFILKNSNGSNLTIPKQRKILMKFASAKNAVDVTKNLSGEEQTWLKDIIATAFFRQTSKLGMSWFIEQLASPDFRFVIVGFNGEELTTDQIRSNKPWKHGNRRKEGASEYAEPITFSEIRHAHRKGYDSKINFIKK